MSEPADQAGESFVMRRTCPAIYIDGALSLNDQTLDGTISDDEGREFTGATVRRILEEDKARGHKYWTGCDNRTPEGRCAGHEVDLQELAR